MDDRKFQARDIALVFDVPPWLIGSDYNDWRTKFWWYRKRPIWLWRHGPERWVWILRGRPAIDRPEDE